MNRYIAFLRGINVSGQKKVPMAELRFLLSQNGFTDVKTYIQSGNVVFEKEDESIAEMNTSLEQLIKTHFGFYVPIIIKSVTDINNILKHNPFTKKEDLEFNRIYFVLLFDKPEKEWVERLRQEVYPNEQWELVNDCLYLKCERGYGKSKLNNNLVERKLKVEATTRNYRTLMKMLELGKN